MTTEYNRSENAMRDYRVLSQRSEHGKSRILIECPFCQTQSWAYLWSLCGGGKKCERKSCGAKFNSAGQAAPVVGREAI